LFAAAPDVPFSAHGTLAESAPWLPRIRGLELPATFAAQNGCDAPGLMPWVAFDVLFLDFSGHPGANFASDLH